MDTPAGRQPTETSVGSLEPSGFLTAASNVGDAAPLEEQLQREKRRRHLLLEVLPGWAISLALHAILILALALIALDPVGNVLNIIQASSSTEPAEIIDEFRIDTPSFQPESTPELPELTSELMADSEATFNLSDVSPPQIDPLPMELAIDLGSVTEQVLPRHLLDSISSTAMSSMLSSRDSSSRRDLLERYGGNAQSEKAVAMALNWLARHQITRGPKAGAWSFNHAVASRSPSSGYGEYSRATNAATAMALLPFLGAGQTHLEGKYQETVRAGLMSLIASMQIGKEGGIPVGSWSESEGTMYSHALASIAMCEAYAMTLDPDLVQPAQLSLNFLIYSQDPRGGGWRYEPKQPGDTSVVGWCLMGLKSGSMGNLSVPPESFVAANRFLDSVSTNGGVFYGYATPSSDVRPRTTAIGLLSRMYLGWPREHAAIQDGVRFLAEEGPKLDDLYFTYYATQVMRHIGGDPWSSWNRSLRDPLVAKQITEGVDAGSWDPEGDYSSRGGRLYQTSLATMILEVYYRHLPLYKEQSLEANDFEI
jgi:hypothetical protein